MAQIPLHRVAAQPLGGVLLRRNVASDGLHDSKWGQRLYTIRDGTHDASSRTIGRAALCVSFDFVFGSSAEPTVVLIYFPNSAARDQPPEHLIQHSAGALYVLYMLLDFNNHCDKDRQTSIPGTSRAIGTLPWCFPVLSSTVFARFHKLHLVSVLSRPDSSTEDTVVLRNIQARFTSSLILDQLNIFKEPPDSDLTDSENMGSRLLENVKASNHIQRLFNGVDSGV